MASDRINEPKLDNLNKTEQMTPLNPLLEPGAREILTKPAETVKGLVNLEFFDSKNQVVAQAAPPMESTTNPAWQFATETLPNEVGSALGNPTSEFADVLGPVGVAGNLVTDFFFSPPVADDSRSLPKAQDRNGKNKPPPEKGENPIPPVKNPKEQRTNTNSDIGDSSSSYPNLANPVQYERAVKESNKLINAANKTVSDANNAIRVSRTKEDRIIREVAIENQDYAAMQLVVGLENDHALDKHPPVPTKLTELYNPATGVSEPPPREEEKIYAQLPTNREKAAYLVLPGKDPEEGNVNVRDLYAKLPEEQRKVVANLDFSDVPEMVKQVKQLTEQNRESESGYEKIGSFSKPDLTKKELTFWNEPVGPNFLPSSEDQNEQSILSSGKQQTNSENHGDQTKGTIKASDTPPKGSGTEAADGKPVTSSDPLHPKIQTYLDNMWLGLAGSAAEVGPEILQDASTSPVGLGNVIAASEKIKDVAARTANGDSPKTLEIVNFSGLKAINDKFGHKDGDEALKLVAENLEKLAEKHGGDAYAVKATNYALVVPNAVEPVTVYYHPAEGDQPASLSTENSEYPIVFQTKSTKIPANKNMSHSAVADLLGQTLARIEPTPLIRSASTSHLFHDISSINIPTDSQPEKYANGMHDVVSQLGKAAYTDVQTGLPNKLALEQSVAEYMKENPNGKIVDMDAIGLGITNLLVGPDAGHGYIEAVAKELEKQAKDVEGGAKFFRNGGDEFLALVPNAQAAKQLKDDLGKLRFYIRPDGTVKVKEGDNLDGELGSIQSRLVLNDTAYGDLSKEGKAPLDVLHAAQQKNDESINEQKKQLLREGLRASREMQSVPVIEEKGGNLVVNVITFDQYNKCYKETAAK